MGTHNLASTRAALLLTFVIGAAGSAAGQGVPHPAHVHIAHVMTSWKDTPEMKGLLPAAIADAQIALEQIERADLEGRINDFWLYGGYVLNALDPGPETTQLLDATYAKLPKTYLKIDVPGSGYGVRRAVAGALQHVQLAAKSEGASENVKTHGAHVAASLENVAKWTDESIAHARNLLTAADVGQGQPLVDELFVLVTQIANGVDANFDGQIGWESGEGGLAQALAHMRLMMKGEGM